MKQKFSRLLRFVLGFFPSKVPVGVAEFEAWVDSFPETYSLPPVDRESLKFILSSTVMHSGPTSAYKSKFHFYLIIMAAAAKQVAGHVFHETKVKREQRIKDEAAAAVATAVISGQQGI